MRSETIAAVEPVVRKTLCRHDATCLEDDADDDVMKGDVRCRRDTVSGTRISTRSGNGATEKNSISLRREMF